jgi:hypothetical protein
MPTFRLALTLCFGSPSRFHRNLKLSELQKQKLKHSNITGRTVLQGKAFLATDFTKQQKHNLQAYIDNLHRMGKTTFLDIDLQTTEYFDKQSS